VQKILVPVDFSPITATVIERGAALARALAGKVWLLHVVEPDPAFVGFDTGPDVVRKQLADRWREEHRQLQDEASRLRAQGTEATARLVQGATAETILAEAERLRVDLIVLGPHRHGTLHKMILGSVSEGVLRHAVCPVLIVPHGMLDRGPVGEAEV
jgi:nucleotide-binding universal stress UspA family protein